MESKIVLGINDAHNSSVCLLKDGRILGCMSEERLRRIKNYHGFPEMSIRRLLADHSIRPDEIGIVSFTSKDICPADLEKISGEKYDTRKTVIAFSYLAKHSPRCLTENIFSPLATRIRSAMKINLYKKEYKKTLEGIGIDTRNTRFYDHHMAHAYSAYCFSGIPKKDCLIFTCDGEGDGLCASVCVGSGGKIERKISIPFTNSIAKMYNEVTWYLGLRPWEHEYKVMGMAPYANPENCKKTVDEFSKMCSIDPNNRLKFRNSTKLWAHTYGLMLRKRLYKQRFDAIALGIQKMTEDILTKWIRNNVSNFRIRNVMLAGGTFMNVKANQKIYDMPEVGEMFVVPSSGDESSAIGACMMGYIELCNLSGARPEIKPIKEIYLGPSFEKHSDDFARKINRRKFGVSRHNDINSRVAELLSKGKIVARCSGRMEFGARALGNRSILADPSRLELVGEINRMIKMRDFWMPFAPSILRERASDYIVTRRKKVDDQYMMVSFGSTEAARKDIKAALHQSDFTCRPQVVDREWNQNYHSIIRNFQKITGIGGILNTSFNIHGEPIVCTPEDAFSTIGRSGLKYLVVDNYLIEKI